MNNPGKYSGLDFDWVTYAEKALTRACKQALASYLASHEVRKLQLGSSYLRLDSWFNTDVIPSKDVFFLDTRRPFPFENSLFDYVFSEHHIEHLSFEEGLFTLQECYRVLVPGGKIRIATPDLTALLSLYTSEPDEMQSRYVQFIAQNFIPKASSNLPVFVINNAFRNWGHQFIYDQATLQWAMEQAGFVEITRTSPGESEDEHIRGIEQHGLPPGDEEINRFETIVLEGKRPLLTEEKRPVLAEVKVDASEKESQQRYEVGVMCSGSLSQDDPRWAQAYQLGKLLAQEGFAVVTGGYQGLMEAVGRGAYEAGGRAVGLPVRSWNSLQPNPWHTELRWSESFGERMDHVVQCDTIVVLPGGLGTLAEMTMAWAAFQWGQRMVILLGESWPPVIDAIDKHLVSREAALACLRFAASPEDVIHLIREKSGGVPPSTTS